jgi:hypothetical protein
MQLTLVPTQTIQLQDKTRNIAQITKSINLIVYHTVGKFCMVQLLTYFV